METVTKKIYIESAISRLHNIPYACYHETESGSTYGSMPSDIVIEESDVIFPLKDVLPLVQDNEGNYVLRYRTMMTNYYAIMEFIKGCVIYKLCFRNNEYIWDRADVSYDDFASEGWDNYYEYLPHYSVFSGETGTLVCITNNPDFLSRYVIDGVHYELIFKDYVENILTGAVTPETLAPPYLNIPLFISQDIDLIGTVNTIDFRCDEEDDSEDAEVITISGRSNSRLSELKRKTTSYDADGNALPFTYKEGIEGGGEVYRRVVSSVTFDYVVGPVNVYNVGDVVLEDILERVVVTPNDGAEFEIPSNEVYDITDERGESGVITFYYKMSATLDGNGDVIEGTGVNYVEAYNYTKEEYTFTYQSGQDDVTVDYILLGEPTEEYRGENGEVSSKIEYNTIKLGEADFLVKDDSVNYIDSIKNINIGIDRGMSASFERHNILSEVNTFQDLENYRNDYFKLTSQ